MTSTILRVLNLSMIWRGGSAHCRLLEGVGGAVGQDEQVAFLAVFVHGAGTLDADAGLDVPPFGLLQALADGFEVAVGGTDEVVVAALAHLAEGLLGGHAAVHQPEVADLAVLRLQLADERHLRALVGGVAG
ncbi:MAG: hypothetical protein IKO01_08045, partial [Kiritimatiellae bacterium]|nr:hypothetical protein [Kiritimatiellia bacterium]